ncbi:MAG: imidazole glycerol phosphate synthase subunit HisH [Solirubrobacteraceae bacterium]
MSTGAPNIAVLDYGMGNRRSVQKALEHVGARAAITREHGELRAADGLLIPGVGAFPLAMRNLCDLGLTGIIGELAAVGMPILGICLGMQLLFEHSEELEATRGLGLIPGCVTWLDSGGLRVPHIGWNEVHFERPGPLTRGLPEPGCPFYHVHSLVARPSDSADVLGTTEYGEKFAALVSRGTIFGAQFHPEKSSAAGLQLLSNFVGLCGGSPRDAAPTSVRAREGTAAGT